MDNVVFENRTKHNVSFEGLGEWLTLCLDDPFILKRLSYVFVSDEELLEVNKSHLDHDFLTDIISFDYSRGNRIKGECWISVDRIVDNAQGLNKPFEIEFRRVVVHGLLHFMGYKDKTSEERIEMREMEEKALSKW